MEKDKFKKLNKATVATILAASGVAVVVPQPTFANTFKDLNPSADYYGPVMELTNRGIISGYSDGTFRPNSIVTRGQAAKMLALALKLDIENVVNPNFKDVPTNYQFYKYIAALVEEGLIDGYSDQTFRPDEPITRGQIAKILSLGYRFSVATKLTHHFEDVPSNNSNAYYIQTLINLNITKGVSPVSFKPNDPITRGQMATFIVRAENADGSSMAVNTVGKIEGNKVYINSVPYSIDPSLTSIFNESNEAILKDAYVEGTFSGKTIKSLSKLTINASGSENRKLQFDGKNTSYSGQLIVNGNYVQFKNWSLTGTVTIGETPRKSLSYYTNRLQNVRIASLNGVGFIDWTKPTEPEDNEFLNPDENEQLKDKPSKNGSSKVIERMPVIERYVDFTNCTVNRLVIEQNRTYVTGDKKFGSITVQKNVEQFELYADAETMYIETDTSVIMYGSSDIDKVYKNSYYDVYFNSDSYFDILAVDNSYGWIDIGDNAYIDKAILPVGKGVNDIFDDFTNDSENIGDIEDENGDDVDRNPDDDEVADNTNPEIIDLDVIPSGDGGEAQLTANESGTYYYVVRSAEDIEKGIQSAPSVREIIVGARGSGQVVKDQTAFFEITGLEEEKDYILYVVVVDAAENVSNIESKPFTTTDGTLPQVNNLTARPLHGGQRIEFSFRPSEPGEYFYYIRIKSTAPDPTTEDIIRNPYGRGTINSLTDLENGFVTDIASGLANNTEYELYVVMRDKWGNISNDPPQKVTVKTGDLDNTPPFIVDGKLNVLNYEENTFYFEVSEELDPETAQNTQNYLLSGTGIINTSGQEEIYPEKVVYDKTNNRIILTIPSLTGFVNGDNLIVTVLPSVKDIAYNDFENTSNVHPTATPRNRAEYIHSDTLLPVLTLIGEPEVNPSKTAALVTYRANKAGTYHYVIMESGIDPSAIDGREMIKAIQDNATTLNVTSGDTVVGIDIVGSNGNNPAQLGEQTVNIPFPNRTALNPYKSYDLYIVLRDRSGNISQVRSTPLIADELPPTITGVDVKVNEGDRSAVLSFTSTEMGEYYYLVRKEGEDPALPTDEDELKAYILENGTKREMRELGNSVSLNGLDPHKDYMLYLAAKDVFGNVTIYKNHRVNNQGKELQHDGLMAYKFYTDGTAPKIGEVVRKLSRAEFEVVNNPASLSGTGNFESVTYEENKTFLVTFSESIILDDPTQNFFVIRDEDGNPIDKTKYTFVFEDYYDETKPNTVNSPKNTWSPRRMIIKFNEEMKSSFSVVIDANAVDINKPDAFGGNNKFEGNTPLGNNAIGHYKYPTTTANNEILAGALTGNITSVGNYKYSSTMDLLVQINTTLDWKQTYYFAVANVSAQNLTADDIIRVVDKGTTIQGVTAGGKDELDVSTISEGSFVLHLKTPVSGQVFTTGQKIYLLTVDQYGNVVMAMDRENNQNNYILITAP